MTDVEPVEITDEGVIFIQVERDENGNRRRIDGTEKLYPASSTIIAVSYGPRNRTVSTTTGRGSGQLFSAGSRNDG